jgi:hypothetical protein
MSTLTQAPLTVARTSSEPVRLQTTLYDLIAAINVEVDPDEQEVVLAMIVQLLQMYRTTYTDGRKTYRLVCEYRSQGPRYGSPCGGKTARLPACRRGGVRERAHTSTREAPRL